jgi:hypothetical protein
MLAETTGMAAMWARFTTLKLKRRYSLPKCRVAGVSKSLMPEIRRGDAGERRARRRGARHRVEVAVRVTAENRRPSAEVLYREAKSIKFN